MVIIIGDIHRNFRHIKEQIEKSSLQNSTLIQVGDFGIGYKPSIDMDILNDLNNFLEKNNCLLYVIRGNHDDPHYFDGTYHYSNLKLMKDYSTEIIENKKYLFCGGATSIDRVSLKKRMQLTEKLGIIEPIYWEAESFVYDEEKLKDLHDIDIVITHTAPEWCYPHRIGSYFEESFKEDSNLKENLMHERSSVSKLFNKLKENNNPVELHFYGHFHQSAHTEWYGISHFLVDAKEFLSLDRYLAENYDF